jgi:hypothetical protein
MAVTIKVLIPAKQAENAQTTQYTAVNAKAIIDKFTGHQHQRRQCDHLGQSCYFWWLCWRV